MRVVQESERLAPPNLCFICETSPVREADGPYQNVVDVQRDFNPPSLSHLSGRKYICDRCVDEAAHLLGYVRTDELDTINEQLKAARTAVGNLTEFAASLSKETAERLASVTDLVPVQVVATPKSEDVVESKESADGA